MLVGYDATIALHNNHERGNYGRTLIARLSSRHIADYHAHLFATATKKEYRSHFSGNANVSTLLPPAAMDKLLPELWLRREAPLYCKGQRIKVFHGLNEVLPYRLGANVKTVVTCYGLDEHVFTSLAERTLWKKWLEYSLAIANAIVAISPEVKQELVGRGVVAEKVVVIGNSKSPFELTDQMVEQYFDLYRKLAGD